jgi:PD-(D/E)XK nuclease superfamily
MSLLNSDVAAASRSRLLASIARVNARSPRVRKRLIGVDINHGRELLLALARETGGWVGWEATTLRSIADALAFVPLHARGLRVASDVELTALLAQAFERVVHEGRVNTRFAGMLRHRGFRTAMQDSLLELRMAGVTPTELARGATAGSPASELVPVLDAYERVLAEQRVADPAGVFRLAVECFDDESPFVLDGITAVVPTVHTRGITGALIRRMLSAGAVVLEVDRAIARSEATDTPAASLLATQGDDFARSVLGWCLAPHVPAAGDARYDPSLVTMDLFGAVTPADELREVCRRVMAEGLRWDAVEIVATDPDTYGIALDALCEQVGMQATLLKGIPLIRTRTGRALERWFAWLGNGLSADVLREALEAGELRLPPGVAAHELAAALRSHRIGWGRARYEALVERLTVPHEPGMLHGQDEVPEDGEQRERARRRAACDTSLRAVLVTMLATTPVVPERGSHVTVTTTTAALAQATLQYLDHLAVTGEAESQAMQRLQNRLSRLAELDEQPTDFASALVALREALSDLRAWPASSGTHKPWRAQGGALHLTDLQHAGASGRARTFVVGLDVERTGGGARQDPLVPDAVRRSIGADRLPEVSDRRAQWTEQLGVALSSLRGRVTLSWPTRGTSDGREAGPSPLVLQAYRVLRGDETLEFEQLRTVVTPPAGAVPDARPDAALDGRDLWLAAIAGGAVCLDATQVIPHAFPMLGAGLASLTRATAPTLSAAHGLVPDAATLLDPSRAGARPLSPSALESLGKCPLHFFYKYGLGLRVPDDPEFDPDAWLDPMQRGSLLHEIFERFIQQHRGAQDSLLDDRVAEALMTIARDVIARWRDREPPPSTGVFLRESSDLHTDVRAFLQMERDAMQRGEPARWHAIELAFGEQSPARYRLTDGTSIALRGRADRVDVLPDGCLLVVDYKTGKPASYRPDPAKGAFNGGRLLQPALYADAVGAAVGQPVMRFEYRFPTSRGGNTIVPFDAGAMTAARDVITSLVGHIRAGEFVPTTDASDCTYCDHAAICRVRRSEYSADSPRAAWAGAHAESLPAYVSMLARRGGGSGDAAGDE